MIKPVVVGCALLEADATLDDEGGIWELLHSFREVECIQGCSKTFWKGVYIYILFEILVIVFDDFNMI